MCAYSVILYKICKPSSLKDVALQVLFKRVHIPTVYAVFTGKGLLAPDDLCFFQEVQSLEETLDYFLAVLRLHNMFDLVAASLNLALILLLRSVSRLFKSESVSGL